MKAVFPGTFDPFTNGHFDLVNRGRKILREIIIAVTDNSGKHILLDIAERVKIAQTVCQDLPNVKVSSFDGLLIDFAHTINAGVILRGLRAVSDFEYEFQLAAMNRNLAPDIETIFLTPDERFSFLSSTLVKDVIRLGGDVSSYLHPYATELIQTKLAKTKK